MGTNRTDITKPLCGFGIPLDIATTEPGDIGTDYTVASMQMGPFVPNATSSVRFEASGTPAEAKDLHIKVATPGVPGPDGMGIVYAETSVGGTPSVWYGSDPIRLRTGYQEVASSVGVEPSSATIKTQDGSIEQAITVYNNGSACVAAKRGTNGVWGSSAVVATTSTAAHDIMQAPDGSLLVYVFRQNSSYASTQGTLHVYRSADSGATWDLQRADALGEAYTLADVKKVRVERLGGQVVCFVKTRPAATSLTRQWASRDGGFLFTEIGSEVSDMTVWDVVSAGQWFVVATTEDVSSTDTYLTRRLGSAFTALSSAPSVSQGAGNHSNECALCTTADGRVVWVNAIKTGGGSIEGKTTPDGGLTWNDLGPDLTQNGSMTDYIREASMVWLNGQALVIANTSTNVVEYRFGGNTTAPLGVDLLSTTGWLQSWSPIDNMSTEGGWTNNDAGGSASYTLNNDTGQNITVGAGVTAKLERSGFSAASRGIVLFTARVASGVFTVKMGGSAEQLWVDMTDTAIRAYDAADTPPSYTTHGISGPVEVLCIFDGDATDARVLYRERNEEHAREWLELDAVTLVPASYSAALNFELIDATDLTGEVDILSVDWVERTSSMSLSDGHDFPQDYRGITMNLSPAYLSNGIGVRSIGSVATVDGVTHTATPASPYGARNMNPLHAPSPRRRWRTADSASDEAVTFAVADGPSAPVTAVWLDGLVGIQEVTIDLGPTVASKVVDLQQAITYDTRGKLSLTASMTTNGSGDDHWVGGDELAGWFFEDAGGNIYRVKGNTAGSLMGQSTANQVHATIFLEASGATVPAAGTGQAGYLYPSRALVLFYSLDFTSADAIAKAKLSFVAADQFDPGTGYREIGLFAVCPVTVLGIAADYNDSHDVAQRANLQETADGYRYTAQRAPRQKTATVAWVESGQDVYPQVNADQSRDYVGVYKYAGAGAGVAAGEKLGGPVVLEGIHRRAAGECVLWLRSIPVIDQALTDTYQVQVFNIDALWCRMPDTYRREAIQKIGPVGYQVWRVPSLALVEEV